MDRKARLQQVQRRVAEMIRGLEHLVELGLFSVEMRRLAGDLTVLSVPKGASKRAGEGPLTRECKGGTASN